ncbi:DUF2851 family protein [Pedobacter sp. ASV28]|uniref:DUF2851 family protein n=1 Tax=Pedobacter sp. ASV28 TaxID=2795123 RepID=UPI0018EA63FD|nr:DUF2851 family protein [Pedobacter sp. ASV28]
MNFSEDFLHFIWQFRLYDQNHLTTTSGETIQVLNCGIPNKDAGPDFSTAKLLIGDTVWVGNIEVHLKSSDWNLHRHQHDRAYDNVILHVVFEDNEAIYRTDGTLLPVLSLKYRIDRQLYDNYQQLLYSASSFPCERQLGDVDEFIVNGFLSRVLVERLEQRSNEVYQQLNGLNGDWDETFYRFMAKSFGFKINALPMQMLAQSLPQQLFAKHKDQPLYIEALLFGQAGFLNQPFQEDYPDQLKKEYRFLAKKYTLTPIDISLWKFLRIRPQNFATLRLAQFAALISASNHLFSKVLSIKNVKELRQLFEELPVNPFWKTHYHFNKMADKVELQLGRSSVDGILVNTVSLFLFAYGKYTGQANFQTRAFYLLESLASEKNAIIKSYEQVGLKINTAYQSQALLQLRKNYCNEKKCLNCGIGLKILKR